MLDRLVDFLIESLKLFECWAIVDPYERGVLLRLGTFKRVLGPGFHWCIPLHIDRVICENVVPRTHRMPGLATTTKDGKAVGFDVVITYRIDDVVKATLEVEDVADGIADSCAGIICTELSRYTWDEIMTGGAPDSLTGICKRRGRRWGVEIQAVQLVGQALVKTLRLTTSAPAEHQVTFGL